MVKAELEMMKGEREESGFDLDKVKNLLELCMGEWHRAEPETRSPSGPQVCMGSGVHESSGVHGFRCSWVLRCS